MFQELITSVKGFLDLSPEKRSTLYALLFCGIIIWYLYNQNQSNLEKLAKRDEDCQIIIKKMQLDFADQLRVNRETDQKEIDKFVTSTNAKSDSLNDYYRAEIRKLRGKIEIQINKLKDETNN